MAQGTPLFDRKVIYEVLHGSGDRWIIDSTHESKADAMDCAQDLLRTLKSGGVMITREVNDSGERIVFQRECSDKPIAISLIEEAAVCETLEDLATFEARKTIGRSLRNYFDERNLTATELIYNQGLLRHLTRSDRLYNQAISRIGTIQANALNQPPPDRISHLFKLGRQAVDRMQDAQIDPKYLAVMNEKGLTAALKAIESSIKPESRTFITGIMLGGYMGQEKDWHKKFDLICDMLEKQPDNQAVVHLDELCAEIIDGSAAIKELLGVQPDLVSALRTMAQLAAGSLRFAKNDESSLSRLNNGFAQYDMPVARGLLFERIAKATNSLQPLTRKGKLADRKAFPLLVHDVIWHAGLAGGIEMSEALTGRARIIMSWGDNDLSARDGIFCILDMLPNPAVKIGYLLDLEHSPFVDKNQALILRTILKLIKGLSQITSPYYL